MARTSNDVIAQDEAGAQPIRRTRLEGRGGKRLSLGFAKSAWVRRL
jgi:hypothetical protein